MPTLLYCLVVCAWSGIGQAQTTVTDAQGEPLISVKVFCKSDPGKGVYTDVLGRFAAQFEGCDSVCLEYFGYGRQCVPWRGAADTKVIVLQGNGQGLREVSIVAKDPISEKFSVIRLEKMDVYLNPVSSGDPLKAITFVAASTNADETADPSLRGSSADRSRVMLNGIPIRSPVRNGQINGLGNFSLFNTEMIDKMYVYASNPPLTFSNTSAGAVEIVTNSELDDNQLQVTAGLAGLGAFCQRELPGGGDNFVQGYFNWQFADGFLGLNQGVQRRVNDFGNADAGLNLRLDTGKGSYLNSYNYGIDEFYQARTNLFSFQGKLDAGKSRFFSATNWAYPTANGNLQVSYLLDGSKQYFDYGNIQSEQHSLTNYYAVDYKHFATEKLTLQGGVCYNFWRLEFDNQMPVSFFNLTDETLVTHVDSTLKLHNPEGYVYANYEHDKKWGFSAGYRTNFPAYERDPFYHSVQASVRYTPNKKHKWIAGLGQYHNFSTPSLFNLDFQLLNSRQAALDHAYSHGTWKLASAVYVKSESGRQLENELFVINRIRTFGLELSIRKNMGKRVEIGLANTYLRRRFTEDGFSYPTANSFNYFLKGYLQYNNPLLINANLTVIARPGQFYTPAIGAEYDSTFRTYVPYFSDSPNTSQYNDYVNVSFSCSRYIPLNRRAIVLYATANNILNRQNQGSEWYNGDFTRRRFDYFQPRTLYFGLVMMFGI